MTTETAKSWGYDPDTYRQVGVKDPVHFFGRVDIPARKWAGSPGITVCADTLKELNSLRAKIAAAPELLETCRDILEAAREALVGDWNKDDEGFDWMVHRLTTAIDKAEGPKGDRR